MQFTAVHHVAVKSLIQRATGIHPVREQRTTQINTLAHQDFSLAMQWCMFTVLAR